ncbi:MAG: hypothetical protein DHS20C18_25790 [Saprospiraceae bacterium]|nr:MAG: hypothetical protein DHS20C18_25790 [Saprospiraceae bacterium]
MLLIKLDELGNVLWQNTYGTSAREFGGPIVEMHNGDLVIAGVTGDEPVLFFMRLDEHGTPK